MTAQAVFWGRVDRSGGPDACWPWRGSIGTSGYGRWRKTSAHRFALIYATGVAIPPGMFVCHTCDNRPCCNPAHLFLGTPADNARDRANKGRNWGGNPPPSAKLSASLAREIRRRHAAGGVTQRALAREYGVSHYAIHCVCHGRTWTEDNPAPTDAAERLTVGA